MDKKKLPSATVPAPHRGTARPSRPASDPESGVATAVATSPPSPPPPPSSPRLLDRLRGEIRARHYSLRTERAYVDWVRRFILFHGKRHPQEMGAAEVGPFLTHLAAERHVAAATQNQAKSALLFLYGQVLRQELPWLDEVVTARTRQRMPVVLTVGEVRALLHELAGTMGLVAALLYGTGMRLLEGLRLRVKDVEFERRELLVRNGKGGKDRVTVLPENLLLALREQLVHAAACTTPTCATGSAQCGFPMRYATLRSPAGGGVHWYSQVSVNACPSWLR